MNTVGIVGCGNISGTYLKNAALFEQFEVAAVADLDPARAASKAKEFGVRAVSVDALLASEVDLVLNLTVPAAHAEVAARALESGKHVYNEKPLAIELGEARALLELAERKGLRVGCAPDTFLGAGLQLARAELEAGLIGRPVAASAAMIGVGPDKWHPDPAFFFRRGAGPLFDMGPYYLTALVHLFGPVSRVSASAKSASGRRSARQGPKAGEAFDVETPTHVSALAEFQGGATATLTFSFDAVAGAAPNIEVYGTEGALLVGDPNTFAGELRFRKADSGWKVSDWQTLPNPRPYAGNSRGLGVAELFQAVAQNRPHRASGALALHVLEAMHAILQSAAERRWVEVGRPAPQPEPLPPEVRL